MDEGWEIEAGLSNPLADPQPGVQIPVADRDDQTTIAWRESLECRFPISEDILARVFIVDETDETMSGRWKEFTNQPTEDL